MRVCLVSTYPPRRCGIATFSRDLRDSLTLEGRNASVSVAAIGASPQRAGEVVVQIDRDDPSSYVAAARLIDDSGFDVVCVQHEFGIFGGAEGRHVLALLGALHTPTVTTLHTVISQPDGDYRSALMAIAAVSDRLVVLSSTAADLLRDVYGIAGPKVSVIPHGVPDVAFEASDRAKAELGLEGRTVALTFGLLSRNKGIEVVLDALPEVVTDHPDLLYVVLGATHPEVRARDGETYREMLTQRIQERGLEKHVELRDRYVSQEELTLHLAACDIYVTPYQAREQIVSGTLAYAVGMGRAVLSTPYLYAQELLAEGRGVVLPSFDDTTAMAAGLRTYLDDPDARDRTRRRAYAHGRAMTWSRVGGDYLALFDEVHTPPRSAAVDTPLPNFDRLLALTDDTGIAQHARGPVPDRAHGYTTDDVARAVIVAVRAHVRTQDPALARAATTCISFLLHAQQPDGSFRNRMGFDRRWLDDGGSDDTLGQALWGLGTVVAETTDDALRAVAEEMFRSAVPAAAALVHPRGIAYAICGLAAGLRHRPEDRLLKAALRRCANALLALFDQHGTEQWRWFGDELTYANAKLPQALLLAGPLLADDRMVQAGLESLDFLMAQTLVEGRFDFVGNAGWYRDGGARATFGQQPIEAAYTIEACLTAADLVSGGRAAHYRDAARAAVSWFAGANRLGVALYDPDTGACADGLDANGASRNAGAESVIVCLLGLMAAQDADLARKR